MSHPFPYSIKRHGTTLEKCEHEPVHTPGCIQAHGVLLVLRLSDLCVLQVSENCADWLGLAPEALLNRTLLQIFGQGFATKIAHALVEEPAQQTPLYLFTVEKGAIQNTRPLHLLMHTQGGQAILEMEDATDAALREPDYYGIVRKTLNRFQTATSLQQLAEIVAEEIRRESSLDRAMVYYFHADDSGEVLAESKRADLNSWLGWRYPSHDIPKPARDIFKKIWSRPVPDVRGPLVEIVPLLNPDTQQPLDMTYCALRGASVMYTEYLDNMGVRAALTLPLVMNGELWGLIACHHNSPCTLSYQVRATCEFLAKSASQQLRLVEEREHSAYRTKIETANYALISKMASELEYTAFTSGPLNLLSGINATGAAFFYEGTWYQTGECPSVEQLVPLGEWLQHRPEFDHPDRPILNTDALSSLCPAAETFAQSGSGALAYRFSKDPLGLVIWFRPETLQTFTWAGNPNELPVVAGPHGARLSPRKSFEIWKETVHHRSLPWQKVEIESALKLRGLMVDLLVSRAGHLERLRSALRLSRARFDISLDAANLGAWELDLSTRQLWRTPRFDAVFSCENQPDTEWNLERLFEQLHPQERTVVTAKIESALAQKEPFRFETRIQDAQGRRKWIWIYGTPIGAENENSFVGLVSDITERRTTDEVSQSRARLNILRSALALTLATETDEAPMLLAWATLLSNHLPESCVLIWTPDETDTLRLRTSSGVKGGLNPGAVDVRQLSLLAQPISGLAAPVPIQAMQAPSPFREAGYELLATFAIFPEDKKQGLVALGLHEDISEPIIDEIRTMIEGIAQWLKRRKAERAVSEANELLRLAVEAGDLGTWDYYPATDVLMWSDRCKALFGLPPEAEVDFSVFLAGLHPDDRERADQTVQRALAGVADGHYDIEFRTVGLHDQALRSVRATGQAFFDHEGKPIRFLGTVQDITETVHAREVLASRGRELQVLVDQRTKELTQTIAELEAFSYSISHDMRSPLRAMQGFSQILLQDYASRLEPEGLDLLRRIERGSSRLDLLIRDVLSFSQVTKGEINLKPVQASMLVEEIVRSHVEFQEPKSSIAIHLPGPPVLAHEAFLSQVFSNLLANAVKFQELDQKPSIVVKSELQGEFVKFWVCDNGIGIAPEHRSRLFQIFGRIHGNRLYEGTGIGLSIVKRAVERMGGEIGLESKVGEGSQFWFTLKAAL